LVVVVAVEVLAYYVARKVFRNRVALRRDSGGGDDDGGDSGRGGGGGAYTLTVHDWGWWWDNLSFGLLARPFHLF
jgi:hypothetical protein